MRGHEPQDGRERGKGALGFMSAAVAAVLVAAWRRVQREGVEARIARRARERERTGPLPPSQAPPAGGRSLLARQEVRASTLRAGESEIEALPVEPPPARPGAGSATSIRIARRRAEPADTIRIVRRSAEPAEPTPVMRRGVEPREPAVGRPPAAGPPRAESARTEPLKHGLAEPPFPAEAPERGRAEPPVPAAAWAGGSAPGPARVPRPMYWPAFLALGVVWAAWGAISNPLLIFAGIAVSAVAIALWIREMIHDAQV